MIVSSVQNNEIVYTATLNEPDENENVSLYLINPVEVSVTLREPKTVLNI